MPNTAGVLGRNWVVGKRPEAKKGLEWGDNPLRNKKTRGKDDPQNIERGGVSFMRRGAVIKDRGKKNKEQSLATNLMGRVLGMRKGGTLGGRAGASTREARRWGGESEAVPEGDFVFRK